MSSKVQHSFVSALFGELALQSRSELYKPVVQDEGTSRCACTFYMQNYVAVQVLQLQLHGLAESQFCGVGVTEAFLLHTSLGS